MCGGCGALEKTSLTGLLQIEDQGHHLGAGEGARKLIDMAGNEKSSKWDPGSTDSWTPIHIKTFFFQMDSQNFRDR